jgi:ribosomal-protein-alanine N-acetyltransferase
MPLAIKIPTLKDLEGIVELDRLCFGGLWTKEGYQRELNSPNSQILILSLTENREARDSGEQIIGLGCFWAILEEAHITLLGIHPEYQGLGLGQFLLFSLLRDARERQLERATLEVKVNNESAISLYQKFGFKIAGKRKGYYQKTGEDAFILWRSDLNKLSFIKELDRWEINVKLRLAENKWSINIKK